MPSPVPTVAFLAAVLGLGCGRLGFDDLPTLADGASGDAGLAACPGQPGVPLDEDGDLVGNPCDVCPHVPDPGQADADGDRVGDACDPEPALARQRIAFFDGFDGPVAGWASPPVIAGGRAQLLAVAGSTTLIVNLPTGPSVVRLAGEILAVGTAPATFKQLTVGTSPMTSLFYYVELIDDGSVRRRSLMRDDSGSYTEFQVQPEGAIPLDPGALDIQLVTGVDGFGAVVDYAGLVSQLSTDMLGPIAGPSTAIYVSDLALVLDYLIQIDTIATQ